MKGKTRKLVKILSKGPSKSKTDEQTTTYNSAKEELLRRSARGKDPKAFYATRFIRLEALRRP